LSSSWERRFPSFHYFGTGETFIFTLVPETGCYHWTGEDSQSCYFMAGDNSGLVVGGGGRSVIFLQQIDEQTQRQSHRAEQVDRLLIQRRQS
jgi:hypothetical protein